VKCTVYLRFRPSTATSRWLAVKWRHFRVTSGHLRSHDVISCHLTASSCELRPCRKWNVLYTPVFGLLHPLPGDFRSNDVTFGSLTVIWGHVTSFPVTWLPPPASYGFVRSEMYSVLQFLAFYSHFQVISGQLTSPRVTSGHLRSRDVISCHVTSSSCELQPCRKWNVQYTPVFGILQPLPGDFRSNDITSGSLPVTWGHVTSLLATWLPLPASYSLVGNEMYSIRLFSAFYSHFQGLLVKWRPFQFTLSDLRSRDVTSCHLTASSCELQPCRKWNVQYTQVFGLLQALPCDFRSNDNTSGSLPVTWGHVTPFPVTWLPPPAGYMLVGSEKYSIRQFSAFYSHFQATSGQMTAHPSHFPSPEVTWRHFLSRDCLLLQATEL